MHLTRTTIVAGLAALSLAVSAAPAVAKGGADTNNTVVSINPDLAPLRRRPAGTAAAPGAVIPRRACRSASTRPRAAS